MTATTEQIWRDLGGSLRGFILNRVADPTLADDLLQEVFVRIHRGIDSLKDEDRLAAWVYRIARNTIADYMRRPRESTVPLGEGDGVAEDADDDSIAHEVGVWLTQMIDELPETYRTAVKLVEKEGATQREVAEKLSLSVSGAKSRVQRGRQRLKDMLLECCHLEFDRRGNIIDWTRRGDCKSCRCSD